MSSMRETAQAYNAAHNLPAIVEGHNCPADAEMGKRIAAAYEKLPSVSRAARGAYAALAREVTAQYAWLLEAGYTLEAWRGAGQPYQTSAEMCADVESNQHLWYFTGGESHPYLGEANDLFRAVHDCFGHAAEGYQFGPRGEHNAWLHHSQMFSPLAQRALTSETRGQNSWVNFGPHAHLPARERPFAAQKAALLPAEMCDWQAALLGEKEESNV